MPTTPPSQVLLQWQSYDALPHERSKRWYLIGSIGILMFAIYGVYEGSWTTTLLALLIGGMYFLMRNEKPKAQTIQLTGLGVQVENDFYPWGNCKDFWILVGRDHTELHIAPNRLMQREIVVFIQAVDPAAVRDVLLQYLPERSGMEERFLDSLARFLKL